MKTYKTINVIPLDFAHDMKNKFNLVQKSTFYYAHNTCFNPNKPEEEYMIVHSDMAKKWELGETYSAYTPEELDVSLIKKASGTGWKYKFLVIRVMWYTFWYSRKHRNDKRKVQYV